MKRLAFVTLSALLTACGASTPPPATAGRIPLPSQRPLNAVGLERVLGQPARALTQMFGTADADVAEGSARKLQFGSRICVLDAYLYPKGSGEPVVTYVDARQRDGSAIDRASCVAALSRRDGGK
ncbi:MAG: hypothetical protein V4537_01100 [Pseudomonadota bacterium]